MMPRVRPLLQLIRLPNVLTAAADSLAGWLLAGGTLEDTAGWMPLAGASMILYAAGMALNDAFDAEVDARERPSRPIPSGRVPRAFAYRLGIAGLVVGPVAAGLGGSMAAVVVAAVLAATILAYDAGLKRTWFGPAAMGACRGLNLLLGLSHAPGLGGPVGWLAAAFYGLFVCGLTWISRSETESGRTRNVLAGLAVQDLAILGLMGVALRADAFPMPAPDRPLIPQEGLLMLALVALAVNLAASRAIHAPTPPVIQKAVKTSILALVWIDVALVASVRGPEPAMAVALIWIPAYFLGRSINPT